MRHPAAGNPHPLGRCDAFAIVWAPPGDTLKCCRDWAAQRGATELWEASAVVAFGFSQDDRGPASRDLSDAAVDLTSPVGQSIAHGSGSTITRIVPVGQRGESWPAGLTAWVGPRTNGVFLGELYRVEQLQAALAAAGVHTPQTGSELIPAAYELWGEDLFERLEGLYCVAFWDHRRQALLLYRDGSCAKALYWYGGRGWAAAATRLDLLTDVPGVPRAIAPAGLQEYLRFLDVSPPATIYRDVRSLEPGVLARAVGFNLDYTKPVYGSDPRQRSATRRPGGATPTFDACVDALDEALRASIAARLDQDGPTGVFLSGGIDSALLCAIAASIDREAIDAFTVGFDERGFDERPVAAAIAAQLGVRHHCHAYDMATYAKAFDDFATAVDVPFADPAGLPTLLLYRDCAEIVDAVLDGTGADTLLGVMPARHLRIATQYAAVLPRTLRHAIAVALRRVPRLAAYIPVFDFDAPEELLIRWKGWSRAEIEALTGRLAKFEDTRFFRVYRRFSRGEHLERYSALLGNLPDDRVHQATDLTGLRVRFPYWDLRVEQLVRSLPVKYCYTRAEPKRLLRALLNRYLPRRLWDLPKHGFDFPFVALLQYDSFALIRRHLDSTVLNRHGLMPQALVQHHVRAFEAGDTNLAFRVWALVVLFAWLEHHQADAPLPDFAGE